MKPVVDFALGHSVFVITIFMGLNKNRMNPNSYDECAQVLEKRKVVIGFFCVFFEDIN